jgi:hypothetical protein
VPKTPEKAGPKGEGPEVETEGVWKALPDAVLTGLEDSEESRFVESGVSPRRDEL